MLLAYNNVQLAALRMNVLIIHVAEKKHSPVAPDSSGLQLQFLLCQISLWSEKNSKKNCEYNNNNKSTTDILIASASAGTYIYVTG